MEAESRISQRMSSEARELQREKNDARYWLRDLLHDKSKRSFSVVKRTHFKIRLQLLKPTDTQEETVDRKTFVELVCDTDEVPDALNWYADVLPRVLTSTSTPERCSGATSPMLPANFGIAEASLQTSTTRKLCVSTCLRHRFPPMIRVPTRTTTTAERMKTKMITDSAGLAMACTIRTSHSGSMSTSFLARMTLVTILVGA